MRNEFKSKLLRELDRMFQWSGAEDFESGMRETRMFFSKVGERIGELETKDQLIKQLDAMPEPSFAEEKMILATFHLFPQLMRWWARVFADRIKTDVDAPRGGRPPIPQQQRAAIVVFINDLHGRGASLSASKKRAQERFHCSKNTVEKIWIERGNIEEVDFRSAVRWLQDIVRT